MVLEWRNTRSRTGTSMLTLAPLMTGRWRYPGVYTGASVTSLTLINLYFSLFFCLTANSLFSLGSVGAGLFGVVRPSPLFDRRGSYSFPCCLVCWLVVFFLFFRHPFARWLSAPQMKHLSGWLRGRVMSENLFRKVWNISAKLLSPVGAGVVSTSSGSDSSSSAAGGASIALNFNAGLAGGL